MDNTKNQSSLFSDNNDDRLFDSQGYKKIEPSDKLEMEFDAFGFYLSEHPTKLHKSLLNESECIDVKDLVDNISEADSKKSATKVIALVSEKKDRHSKNGKKFCFLKLSDDTGDIDTICFSEVLDSIDFDLKVGKIVIANLTLQRFKDSQKYLVASLCDVENVNSKKRKFEVSINSELIDHNEFKNFFIKSSAGNSELLFKIFYNEYRVEIKSEQLFKFNFDEISNLKKINGILDVIKIN